MQTLWKSARRYIFIIVFGVLFYQLFENLAAVRQAVSNFFSILQPLFMGIAFAFIVNMPLRFFESRVFARWNGGSLKRGVCILLSLLLVLGVIVAVCLLIFPRVIESLVSLVNQFDAYMSQLSIWAARLWEQIDLREDIVTLITTGFQDTLGKVDDILVDTASAALKGAASVVGLLADLLIAFIMSMYAIFNKEKFLMQARKVIRAIFAEPTAQRILEICSRTNAAMNSYFKGMIIDCFMLGTLCFIAMSIFSFPYALLISVTIGCTQIVPIVGPWIGAAVGALLILIVDPPRAIWFVIMLLIVQQLDNNIIYPRIVGNAVGLSGIWVLIAILLGGGLWGLGGIVLSVPLMAVCYTTVSEWVNKRLEEKRG